MAGNTEPLSPRAKLAVTAGKAAAAVSRAAGRGSGSVIGGRVALKLDPDLLARLASGPTIAIGLAKQALSFGQHATLGQSMMQELFNLELSCRTSDFKEGLEAFRQRRTPKFDGR